MKIIVVVKREAEAPIDKTNELWLRLCWWCTNTNGLPAAAATKDVCPPFVIILHSILGGDTQYPLGTLPTYQGVLGTLVLGDTLDHHLFSPHFVIVLSPFYQRNSFQNQISSLIFTDTHKYKLWGFTMMMSEWMPSLLHPNTGLCNVFWCVPWHNSVRNCHRLRAREALIFTALIFLQFDCGGYPAPLIEEIHSTPVFCIKLVAATRLLVHLIYCLFQLQLQHYLLLMHRFVNKTALS